MQISSVPFEILHYSGKPENTGAVTSVYQHVSVGNSWNQCLRHALSNSCFCCQAALQFYNASMIIHSITSIANHIHSTTLHVCKLCQRLGMCCLPCIHYYTWTKSSTDIASRLVHDRRTPDGMVGTCTPPNSSSGASISKSSLSSSRLSSNSNCPSTQHTIFTQLSFVHHYPEQRRLCLRAQTLEDLFRRVEIILPYCVECDVLLCAPTPPKP